MSINIVSIKQNLNTSILGQNIISFEEIDSTNTYMKNELKNESGKITDGTVVIAERQTCGRGRMGRSFISDEGKGIYMSVLLSKDIPNEISLRITPIAAVAVVDAIEEMCQKNGKSLSDVKIKWVNDIYINQKKVCGILTESVYGLRKDGLADHVVGIGVNLYGKKMPAEIEKIATSFEKEGVVFKREEMIAEILNKLEKRIEKINSDDFLEKYKRCSNILTKRINVLSETPYIATAIDINEMGALIVEKEDGTRITINTGEVSVRTV